MKLNHEAIKLIEGKNFALIATIMRDGTPQVSPVWIDHEGDIILVNTAIGRLKQRNLARDPHVAISLSDQNDPYDKVLIRGLVVSQTTDGAEQHIDKLAKKYLGRDKYPSRAPGERRIIIRIEANRISN